MRAYHSEALADPSEQIRVAVLQPGEFDSDIHVIFEICSLTALLDEYEALSYVWGSEVEPAQAFVTTPGDGSSAARFISITNNLERALRYLRKTDNSRRLWIDALCIDQQANTERSIQVSIMAEIYSSAVRVVAWLGEHQDGSEEAFALLTHVSQKVQIVDQYTLETCPVGEDPDGLADRGLAIPWQHEQLRILYSLMRGPYFERVWIQQELQLAKVVVLQCGTSIFEERNIWTSLSVLCNKSVSRDTLAPISSTAWAQATVRLLNLGNDRLQPWRVAGAATPLVAIRHRVRGLNCQDPRDKIYAFLGMMGDQDKSLRIMPDYSRSVEEVYTYVTRLKATTHRSLELLWSCELSSKSRDLPSWCPDFSTPQRVFAAPTYLWSACGFISANVSFSNDECIASGLNVSRVLTVHPHMIDGAGDRSEAFFDFMGSIRPSQAKPARPYKNGQAMTKAYCRALVGDRVSDREFPCGPLPDVEQCRKFLEAIWWRNEATQAALQEVELSAVTTYMNFMGSVLESSCFVTTTSGFIGIAPFDTKPGDVVSIILGCHKPIILRPANRNKNEQKMSYLVVGGCYIHGIMDGEIIYKEHESLRYKAIAQDIDDVSPIDQYTGALFDRKTNVLTRDPTVPLEAAGIEVESYLRDPHSLIVSLETLRAAGLAVEDFVLV